MPIDRIFARYRVALGLATLLMVGMSWPLWLDDPDFPRIPFLGGLPVLPGWVSVVNLGGIILSLILASLGRWGRATIAASIGLIAFAVVQDQNRLQPWVYQYLVIGIGLVGLTRARALALARWYTVALYAYSGLSKLDLSFCRELGPTFLSAGLGLVGQSAERWPESLRTLAILAMPGSEIVVAGFLAFRSTRRVGLVGSMIFHGVLVLILGPWCLGHSAIVLVWNLAQVIENLCLFLPTDLPTDAGKGSKLAPLAWLIGAIALILPIGERAGWADAWPSHALYASHAERSDVSIHGDDLDKYPETIRRHLGPVNATPWRHLDLTGWSREVRGTPLYPSGRIGNGVAEFLASRYGGINPIRLIQWSRAAPLTGERSRDESLGLRAIRRRADRFLLNARPAF